MVKAQVSQPQGVRAGELSCPLQAAALGRVGHTFLDWEAQWSWFWRCGCE